MKNFVCLSTEITPLKNGGYVRDVSHEEMLDRLKDKPFEYGRFIAAMSSCPFDSLEDKIQFYAGVKESVNMQYESLVAYSEGRHRPIEEFLEELRIFGKSGPD